VSLVFGLLLESVTTNLSDIGRARREARALALAEQRVREIESELNSGMAVELGESEGAFEEPDEDLHWHITVSEHTLDLPADYPPDKESPSPLFARPGAAPARSGPGAPGQGPQLRLIEVRVFPADAELESADPFVLLVTAPPDAALLQQVQQAVPPIPQQTEGAPENDSQ